MPKVYAKNSAQPRGGFLPIKKFEKQSFECEKELHPDENLKPVTMSAIIDNSCKLALGCNLERIFEPSREGLKQYLRNPYRDMYAEEDFSKMLQQLSSDITLDMLEIVCKLSVYQTMGKAGISDRLISVQNVCPTEETLENLLIMVNRTKEFFKTQTKVINCNECILTEDAFIMIKGIKSSPNTTQTWQLMLDWMLMCMKDERAKSIHKLVIFNPRINVAYFISVDEISETIANLARIEAEFQLDEAKRQEAQKKAREVFSYGNSYNRGGYGYYKRSKWR